ncbi:squalene--hopene cyclase [Metabacillus sp. HB246100]
MVDNNKLLIEITHRLNFLKENQLQDGSWHFCFEGGLLTDACMIITIRSLAIENEEEMIKALTKRIVTNQTPSGAWRAYSDESDGNLSATVQAYFALLYSGYYTSDNRNMQLAKQYIEKQGGLSKTHFMTKWFLAVNGLYPWPSLFYIPMTFLLIPQSFPLNFYQLSTYARIHFISMIIPANKKFSITSKYTPTNPFKRNTLRDASIDHWDLAAISNNRATLTHEMKKLVQWPSYLHRLGYDRAEKYILERIEDDGTLYSYASATIFMIYALLSLGYHRRTPIIKNAIKGLKNLLNDTCNGTHLENSTSTVWDTALISYAVQEVTGVIANTTSYDHMIHSSVTYILSKQHKKYGDWSIHNPSTKPGGFGFSDNNSLNPDNDDTSAALRALTKHAMTNRKSQEAWYRGVTYLLSMQNQDGGWAAFEKNTDLKLLALLPLENAIDAAIDPSTPDLTGRTLEFLGNFAGLTSQHPQIQAAVNWLIANQEKNGSWYGRWGVCYIYGTWAAITGLIAVGIPATSTVIQKATIWLQQIQLENGGWGESCKSCERKEYTPLTFSTPSQTAWALDALIQANLHDTPSVTKGITHLLNKNFKQHALHYPTGIGLPGQFYITYHSYNHIYPLLTFSHYLKKLYQ